MATKPTWSGSIQISLVSIAVKIFPASNPGAAVEFHQIDRKTHKRVHHQNVDTAGKVEKADIVKGFEYAKDKYIEIAPEELKELRLATASTMSKPKRYRLRSLIGLFRGPEGRCKRQGLEHYAESTCAD